ncbi:ComF family protein [Loktanella sp. IMCC34160]|uniref:ComF family protein n=1 Tax=Loktanella sp. IMCC34160 TaxID=2510646 RepID=UPI00101D8DA9|nr:double zinc ribbon domain-containing protein [Loktanella sp. IMCC34160]RYG91358.1 ComF family protein [Loktanella sp. IMCC34160]
MLLESVVRTIYPPGCVLCGHPTEADFGLCGTCWSDADFLDGAVCMGCGAPVPGPSDAVDLVCEDCHRIARPWHRGRAVARYSGSVRKMILSLKHGDRAEMARAAGPMLARVAAALPIGDAPAIVPVPLHWTRMLKRRFNQSALLAQAMAGRLPGAAYAPDALVRVRRTASLEGQGRDERFATLQEAIRPHPRQGGVLAGRSVLIVDDVMTSGATLAAATEAAHAAGATQVCVLVLARVVKDT